MIDTIIIDRGHATLDIHKKYATPGKQFTFPDGLKVYEGYENQKYAEVIAKFAMLEGFQVLFTVKPNDPKDPTLIDRVKYANTHKDRKTSLFLSIHNNAGGGKGQGTEVFTSKGKTLSDTFSESIFREIAHSFPYRKMRTDTTDGDMDKEENFYVLKNTSMPAVLLEIGFFDNREDYEWLSNPANIEQVSRAIVEGIKKAVINLYGEKAWVSKNL